MHQSSVGVNDGDGLESYAGPAELEVGTGRWAVDVRLTGRLEPVDGYYHWGGRIAPHGEVAGLVRGGHRQATLRVPGAPGRPVRLTEIDPWGGVLVAATGPAPWPAGELDHEVDR